MKKAARQVERLAFSVDEVVSTGAFRNRNKVYDAIARGDLQTWKDGRSRMISAQSVRDFILRRIREQMVD